MVSLDEGVDIEVTDGTRRVFPAGTVMLAEDTWGKVCCEGVKGLFGRTGHRQTENVEAPSVFVSVAFWPGRQGTYMKLRRRFFFDW